MSLHSVTGYRGGGDGLRDAPVALRKTRRVRDATPPRRWHSGFMTHRRHRRGARARWCRVPTRSRASGGPARVSGARLTQPRALYREDALPYGSAGTRLRRGPPRRTAPHQQRAIGSAGERLVHTEEVTGSIPVSPTDIRPGQRLHEQLSSYSADGSCRRIGRNLGGCFLCLVIPGRERQRGRLPAQDLQRAGREQTVEQRSGERG